MKFFSKKNASADDKNAKICPIPDESFLIRHRFVLLRAALCLFSGMLYAAALAPFNWSFAAFCTLPAVIWCACRSGRWYRAGAYGWLWGLGWSFFAFRFLREIDPVIPWLMGPVISLWPAVWAAMLPALWRYTVFPAAVLSGGVEGRRKYLANGIAVWRMTVFVFGAAALFTLLEWSRSRLFVWNDFAATQYRNILLLQVAGFTGGYGINFLVALGNTGIFSLFFRRGRRAAFAVAAVFLAVTAYGYCKLAASAGGSTREIRILAVQGDVSQRRHASLYRAEEALYIYRDLTLAGMKKYPDFDFAVWPESAVPLCFDSRRRLRDYKVSSMYDVLHVRYQETLRRLAGLCGKPLLVGTTDSTETIEGEAVTPGMTNSALIINPDGMIGGRYDKMHRVPFGEYVPFRKYIPDFIADYIDMGYDLVPGTNPKPLEIIPGARAGISVCYEGVFSYHTRKAVDLGANFLLAVSNDAWYPLSSEPEQHLANVTLRAVETGLPMVRVGNNGGTGILLPDGRFTQCPVTPGGEERPELGRGRAVTLLRLELPAHYTPTFFIRYGEWFVGVLAAGCGIWISCCIVFALRRRYAQLALNENGC